VFIGEVLAMLLLVAGYNYNRQSLLYPTIALTTALSIILRPIRWRTIVVGGLVLGLAWFAFGNYRTVLNITRGGQYTLQQTGLAQSGRTGFWNQFEIYGQAPQLQAIATEAQFWGQPHDWGSGLVKEVLAPIPKLGKGIRDGDSTSVFNRLIYAPQGESSHDQIITFASELNWSYGFLGIVVGMFAVGWIVASFHRRLLNATTILAAFTSTYVGMWIGALAIVSLQVISQELLTFATPALLLLVIDAFASRNRRLRGLRT